MKTVIAAVVAAILAAGGTFFAVTLLQSRQETMRTAEELGTAQETAQKKVNDFSSRIQSQLQSLAKVIAANNTFSLKILVENDRSAPEVTELAAQFMRPMGFSVLEITDSSRTILSSGHFPASAGNKSLHQPGILTNELSVTMENIMGTPTLTMQAEYVFSIAEFTFYLTGGIVVDEALLQTLEPNSRVELLLKNGDKYLGRENISSVSPLTDNEIIINDKKYQAAEIPLPVAGMDGEISLIVLMK